MSNYFENFKDPRWQKKRLGILNRDDFACQQCFDKKSTLHVHHKWYGANKMPWDYPDSAFVTLCECCHLIESEELRDAEHDLILSIKQAGFMAKDIQELTAIFI